ncbi:MAG: DUF5684 domain-containing protein [Candidatus Absconditabacterales bacterium]
MFGNLVNLSGSLATMQGSNANFTALMQTFGVGALIILFALLIFFLIVFWKIFKKAGYNGYEAIISGHNFYTYVVIAGKPGRYFFLLLIPYLLVVMSPGMILAGSLALGKILMILGVIGFIYLYYDLTFSFAKKFNKSKRFGVGLFFLPFIFYPIIGLGSAKYGKNNVKKEIIKAPVKKIIRKYK